MNISVRCLKNSKLNFKSCCMCNRILFQIKSHINTKSNLYCTDVKGQDPVFEKYRKYLSNLNSKATDEFIYETKFGSVRFDTEVTVTEEIVPERLENNRVAPAELNAHESNSNGNETLDSKFNYIDEYYFKESVSNIESSKYSQTENRGTSAASFTKPTDLNYIDSQYIITEEEAKLHVEPRQPQLPHRDAIKEEAIPFRKPVDLNYIDSQYIVTEEDFADQPLVKDATSGKKDEVINEARFSSLPAYDFEESLFSENEECVNQPNVGAFDKHKSVEDLENELSALAESASTIFSKRQNQKKKSQDLLQAESDKPGIKETKALETEKEYSSNSQNSSDFQAENVSDYKNTDISRKVPNEPFRRTISALDYVKNKRKEEHLASVKSIKGEILPHENFKKVLFQIPRFSFQTDHDMVKLFKKSVLYNADGIVALYKPYGIPVHGSGSKQKSRFNINDLLEPLAESLKMDSLELVHRLDIQTTGILLLAKNSEISAKLKELFRKHLIRKSYLAITKNVPKDLNGVIDIPIGEGSVGENRRMVLRPDIEGFRGRAGQSKKAVTRYKVLSRTNATSLLEISPITGAKHQIRVHLGFGIDCPVLGDHKYSYLTKMVPQKLPGDVLQMYGMKQSQVRNLPIHLHALSVAIPEVREDGREIFIKVGPPKFFKTSLRTLNLSKRNNRLTDDYSDILYGY